MKVHKINLEDILFPHKLNHSRHDKLIKSVATANEVIYHDFTIAMNAYYKIADHSRRGGWLESDIDLLQMSYDHRMYGVVDNYQHVPFDERVLEFYEMKSHASMRNYNKAIYQLNRHKYMMLNYTDYKESQMRFHYAYWDGEHREVVTTERLI